MADKPQPFPVREREGQWEVLVSSPEMWLQCDSEHDARVLAKSIVLRYEVLEDGRRGNAFADELQTTSDVLAKYRIGFLSRFFKRRAKEAHGAE